MFEYLRAIHATKSIWLDLDQYMSSKLKKNFQVFWYFLHKVFFSARCVSTKNHKNEFDIAPKRVSFSKVGHGQECSWPFWNQVKFVKQEVKRSHESAPEINQKLISSVLTASFPFIHRDMKVFTTDSLMSRRLHCSRGGPFTKVSFSFCSASHECSQIMQFVCEAKQMRAATKCTQMNVQLKGSKKLFNFHSCINIQAQKHTKEYCKNGSMAMRTQTAVHTNGQLCADLQNDLLLRRKALHQLIPFLNANNMH